MDIAVDELRQVGNALTGKSAETILKWALNTFPGRVTMASSFGLEDVVLIDQVTDLVSSPDVFFLDTGLLFAETYQTLGAIESRYGFKVRCIEPELTVDEQNERYGTKLWARDPDACCGLRKVAPLKRALLNYSAWITGIRREQSATRAQAQAVEWDQAHGLVKINPLVLWSTEEVWTWIRERGVPYNPLHDQGYPSIGCAPCTRPVQPGDDPRAGRWSGFDKKECGLHP